MDAAQWAQQVGGFAKAMEEIQTPNSTSNNNINPTNNNNNNSNQIGQQQMVERRLARPQKDQNLNCPRCNSTNTKFCYYNNYSLTQPRYFCKTCRRYWTQGGSLRNVPVGGGSRKNKRSSSSSPLTTIPSSSSSSTPHTKLIPDLNPPSSFSHFLNTAASQNPKFLQGQDLNLAFPIQGIFHPMEHHHHHHHQFPKIEGNNNTNNENIHGNIPTNSSTTTAAAATVATTNSSCGGNSSTPLSALELLRTGIASRGSSLSSYVPMPMAMQDSNSIYHPSSTGLIPNLQEFKPTSVGSSVLSSPSEHPHHDHHHQDQSDNNMLGSGAANNGGGGGGGGGGARLLFPFADMNKLASSTTQNNHEIDDQSKAGSDDHHHHHHNNNNNNHHHHHQGPTGYWTGMLGGGTW